MSKEVKSKIMPKLRFPEFINHEGWMEAPLNEIGDTLSGLSGKSGSDFGEGKSFVTYKQVFKNSRINISECGKVLIHDGELQNTLQLGDILFTTSSETPNEVGFASVILETPKEKTYMNSFCFALRPFDINEILPNFSRYLFHSPIYRKAITALAQGSTRYNISKGAFLNLKLPIPKPKEQRKISDCLSSLDELISAHSEKLDVLKDHKKGLMQQLFPAYGKKIPEFRFGGFEEGGEWLVEPLSKIYSFITTNSLPRDNLNYEEGDVKNIHYGDIHTKFSALFDITKERVPFINSSISLEKTRVENYCREGDIIFADASEDLKDIGKMIELVNLNNEKLLSGLHTLHARQVGSKLVVGFAGHLFISNSIRRQIQREAQGSKVLSISVPRISNISITYPKDKKEQQKIADLLTSLDELIMEQAQKIDELKIHKKGLMQGLFPSLN